MTKIQLRIVMIVLAVVAGLVLAGVFAAFQKPDGQGRTPRLIAVTSDEFAGPFTVVDQDGKTITEKDYAGQYKLIYFGFTFCPAICPTELSKMTTALKALSPAEAEKIQPLFVTVDPERDTPKVMKTYISMFHPKLIGLTGTPEQIKDMLKTYKIYAAKVEDPALSEYTMDHSSFVYFIAPDGRLLHIFKMPDTAAEMQQTIQAWLSQK